MRLLGCSATRGLWGERRPQALESELAVFVRFPSLSKPLSLPEPLFPDLLNFCFVIWMIVEPAPLSCGRLKKVMCKGMEGVNP